jgi:hypothetical protein
MLRPTVTGVRCYSTGTHVRRSTRKIRVFDPAEQQSATVAQVEDYYPRTPETMRNEEPSALRRSFS